MVVGDRVEWDRYGMLNIRGRVVYLNDQAAVVEQDAGSYRSTVHPHGLYVVELSELRYARRWEAGKRYHALGLASDNVYDCVFVDDRGRAVLTWEHAYGTRQSEVYQPRSREAFEEA